MGEGEEWMGGTGAAAVPAVPVPSLRLKLALQAEARERRTRERARSALPASLSALFSIGPNTLIFVGANFLGAKAQRGSKGAPPTRALLRALASQHCVVLLDECLSSQVCCRSLVAGRHPHTTDADWRDGRFLYSFWRELAARRGRRTLPPAPRKTFKARYCETCHLHVHADVNAACNLLLDGLYATLLPRRGRPAHLHRYAGSQAHRQLAPGVTEAAHDLPRRRRPTARARGSGSGSGAARAGARPLSTTTTSRTRTLRFRQP